MILVDIILYSWCKIHFLPIYPGSSGFFGAKCMTASVLYFSILVVSHILFKVFWGGALIPFLHEEGRSLVTIAGIIILYLVCKRYKTLEFMERSGLILKKYHLDNIYGHLLLSIGLLITSVVLLRVVYLLF